MNFEDKQDKKIIELFRKQSFGVEPDKGGLKRILEKIDVTENEQPRYMYKRVNIISQFSNYMSHKMKFSLALAVVAIFVIGVVYIEFRGVGREPEVATVSEQVRSQILESGNDDIKTLLTSLDQEQSEEVKLLAAGYVDDADFADEGSLLEEINQMYKDEL